MNNSLLPYMFGVRGLSGLVCLTSIAVWLHAAPVAGQAPEDGDAIQIALVTFGPGDIYWERFGHNGLWVRDPQLGIDSIFDYGRFSFNQSGFLWRFARGLMEYSIGSASADRYIRYYQSVNRSVWIQTLNLTAEQKRELRDFLLWNNQPENREYRYHYFYDNCSTRLRDALDSVVAGRVRSQLDTIRVAATYRTHALRLSAYNLPLYTGLLIGLGSPTDRPLTADQESFLPMKLMEHVRLVHNQLEDGSVVPLVASERVLYLSTRETERSEAPRLLLLYLTVGVLVALVMGSLSVLAARGPHIRWPFTIFAVLWSAVVGIGGCLLAFLWIFTDHNTSYWNENLMFLTPLALPVMVALPLALRGKVSATRWTVLSAGAVAVLSVVGFVVQVLPWFNQVNGQVIALMLPPNVALLASIIAVLGHPERSTVNP